MRRMVHFMIVGSAVAVFTGCAARASPGGGGGDGLPQPALADSVSAHQAAAGFLAAFDSLQWEPFRSYLAEDITMFFPFPQVPARVDGREAVGELFGQFFAAQREARTRSGRPLVQGIAPRDLRIQMAGADVAVVTFHLGAEALSRRSVVFRRVAGDEWRVVHWHASPPPQSAQNQ